MPHRSQDGSNDDEVDGEVDEIEEVADVVQAEIDSQNLQILAANTALASGEETEYNDEEGEEPV